MVTATTRLWLVALLVPNRNHVTSFVVQLGPPRSTLVRLTATPTKESSSSATEPPPYSFIATELRGAAMKLHTKAQAPREGQAAVPASSSSSDLPYVTTLEDYRMFLADSLEVYRAMEEIVAQHDALSVFRTTGLERTEALTRDIEYLTTTYHLGPRMIDASLTSSPGRDYAARLRGLSLPDQLPAFICHYYNFYFAHTAGGRMMGKQLSASLLNRHTLDFYVWEHGDLNTLKQAVKDDIEALAATWNDAQKQQCVDATAAAFAGGGAINGHLAGRYR